MNSPSSSSDFFADWAASAQLLLARTQTQNTQALSQTHQTHAYAQENAQWSAGEIVALLDLLRVAEQVIFSLPPDVKGKYLYIRSMVAKNIEKERLNARAVVKQKALVEEDAVQQQVKIHQEIQVSKLLEIQTKVSKLKASVDEFNHYVTNMYPTMGEKTESPSPVKKVIPVSPSPSNSFSGDNILQNTSAIFSLLQQTQQSFANLQQTTKSKLHSAHTLSSELSESDSKLSKIENEFENFKVETSAKTSKHSLEIKQLQREHSKQMHALQNELLEAKSNVLRNLNSSSSHERAIATLTTEYELKLAESTAKIAQLENKVHEFDSIAKALDIPAKSDVASKVMAQNKALQEAQKYSQDLVADRAKLRAQIDFINDSNRNELLQLREQFLDVQSRAQLTLQTLEAERKSNLIEKEKMKQKLNELQGMVQISEEQQRELENTTSQFHKIIMGHSHT